MQINMEDDMDWQQVMRKSKRRNQISRSPPENNRPILSAQKKARTTNGKIAASLLANEKLLPLIKDGPSDKKALIQMLEAK